MKLVISFRQTRQSICNSAEILFLLTDEYNKNRNYISV